MTTTTIVLGDLLDYVIDFRGASPGPWLAEDDAIASHTVAFEGAVESAASSTVDDGAVTVWVKTTGTAKVSQGGSVSVQITTNAGRIHTEQMQFVVT